MYYYTSGNSQIRVAFTAAMMKLKGAKIPPTIVFPIQLQNQRVRDSCTKGYPQEASATSLIPLSLLHQMYPLGGTRTEKLSTSQMSIPGPASPAVLSLRGVSKAFGAVQALRDVSVDCRAGEIHALVGENGSGKSTLLGIASGFVPPDEGAVEIGGQPRRGAARPPRRAGSVSASPTRPTRTSSTCRSPRTSTSPCPRSEQPAYGRMEEWAAERLAEFDLDIPLTAPTGSLSLAERQLLEVVKALLARPKVLLLDEPTTALGPEDVERLHALVLEQSRAGVGIVYVSHRLPEVLGIADRITVLRDGVCQGTFDAAVDVRGEPRRADDRPAAPARVPGAARRRGASARCCWPSRACAASASGRSTSRSRRARSSASPAPRATGRCRSCARSPASSARPAARPATAASSTRARRSARSARESCC